MPISSRPIDAVQAPQIAVTLLGEFTVSVNGVAIDASRWKHKHPRLLWQMLCLAPGHCVSRDEAAEALWPQAGVQASSNRLYHTLHTLRGVFSDAGVADARRLIALQGGTLRLDAGVQLELDVERFRQAVDDARTHHGSDAAMALFEKAQALHGDGLALPPAAGDWFARHREALLREQLWVLEQLVQHYQAAGQPDAVLPAAQALARLEPANEAAHRRLIEVYDAQRRPDLVAQQYAACSRHLRRASGAQPSPAMRQWVERIVARSGEQAALQAEPTRACATPRYAAPARATPLLGREAELEALQRLLLQDDGARLVTIVAAGGIGKTRLAAALAELVQDDFADGVCFVALGEVPRLSLLAERVCQALGVSTSAQPAADVLMGVLASQQRLLVLDRCEHLSGAAPLLTMWLQAAPRLCIVATSQCALRSRAEQVYELLPLSVRSPLAAVELFASAARLAGAPVDARRDEVAIRSVCERVGGNALAIELAGAQLPNVPLAAMAAALETPLRMLAGASAQVDSRLTSLQATIAWSVSLLTPSEARLLALLCVFAMPFGVDDAHAVVGSVFDQASVQSGLRTLLHRHLLSSNTDPSQCSLKRFAMSDGVREFLRARAAADPDAPRVGAAHAEHFGSVMLRVWACSEKGELTLARPVFLAAVAEIDAALQWMREHGDVEVYLHRCWQYGHVQNCLGAVQACTELMRHAVQLPMRSDAARHHGARCATLLGVAHELAGDLREATKAALQARRLARSLDDSELDCRTAMRLARLYMTERRVDRAMALIDLSLRKSHSLERPVRERFMLCWMQGECFETRGQHAQALAATERALDCAHEMQHALLIGHVSGLLALVAIEQGHLTQAERTIDDMRLLSLARLSSVEGFNLALVSGMLAFERCSFDQAARHFDRALEFCQTGAATMTLTARLWQEFTLIETGQASRITALGNLTEAELTQADRLTITCIHARAYRVALQAEQGSWAAVRLSIENFEDYVRPTGNALWASVLAGGAALAVLCIGERKLARHLLDLAQWLQARIGVVPTPRQRASWARTQARVNDAPDKAVSAEAAALMPQLVRLSHDLPRWCGFTEGPAVLPSPPGERTARRLPVAA
jgi:DNA-binding SARP family transcriptional activator/predicted ATPase